MIIDKLNQIVPVTAQPAGNGVPTGPSGIAGGLAITGDGAVGDVINLRQARDLAIGQEVYLVVTVTEAFVGPTSVEFQVKASSDDEIVESTDATIATTGAILVAQLVKGAQFVTRLNIPTVPELGAASVGAQYLGVYADFVGTATLGKVLVDFVLNPQTRHIDYRTSITVL